MADIDNEPSPLFEDSAEPSAYWRKLKQRPRKEGNETVTSCHGLKMAAADGKGASNYWVKLKQRLKEGAQVNC